MTAQQSTPDPTHYYVPGLSHWPITAAVHLNARGRNRHCARVKNVIVARLRKPALCPMNVIMRMASLRLWAKELNIL